MTRSKTVVSTLVGGALALGAASVAATAGVEEDCNQRADAHAAINGCRLLIDKSGLSKTIRAAALTNRAFAYAVAYPKDLASLARRDLDDLVALDPGEAASYYKRALIHEKIGDYDRAIADYTKALVLNPHFEKAAVKRSAVYATIDRVIAELGAAISVNPLDSVLYFQRATAFSQKGDQNQALADWGRAISVNPRYFYAREKRASTYLEMGKPADALAEINLAIGGDYQNDYYRTRSRIFGAMGRMKEAESDRHLLEGLAYRSHHSWDGAITNFSLAIALDPRNLSAYLFRAQSYSIASWSRGKQALDLALADYDKAISLDPANYDAYLGRAHTYARLEDHDRSLADIGEAARLSPGNAEPHLARGWLHVSKGDFAAAIADATAAISFIARDTGDKSVPGYSFKHGGNSLGDALLNRGRIYEQKGDRDRAIADYRAALPDSDAVAGLKRLGVEP